MEPLITHRDDEAGPSRGDEQDQDDSFVVSGAISSLGFSKDMLKVSIEVSELTLTDKLPVSLTNPFSYNALDNRPDRFRLLRLLPRRRAWIECELHDSLISNDNRYEALSYVWGSDERVESIFLNGKEFWITDNLYVALENLTLPDKDRVLWVDGICIDQSNNDEKSQQVQRMSSIYSTAETVLFWLGKATEEAKVLMRFLQQLESDVLALNRSYSRRDVEDLWSSLQEAYGFQKETHAGLVTLLRRPWFSRVWILQEVAKARLGLVCAGRTTVSSSIFALAPWLISVGDENPSYWKPVIGLMSDMPEDDSDWARNPDVYDLLRRTMDTQATNPRDKVFALLGMSGDLSDRDSIIVDYDKPVHEVYQDLLRYLARSEKSRVDEVLDIAHRAPGVATLVVLIQHIPSKWESKKKRKERLKREQDTSRYWTEAPWTEFSSVSGARIVNTATIAKTDVHVFTWQLSSDSSVPVSEGLYTEVLRMEEAANGEDWDVLPGVHHWIHREGHVKLLCLKKFGSSGNSRTFEYAATKGMFNLLHLLFDLGVVQLSSCNALSMAYERGDRVMVEALLDMGFDPELGSKTPYRPRPIHPARDNERRFEAPLTRALRIRDWNMVKIFVQHGADIDRKIADFFGGGTTITLLGLALASGQCHLVELMVTKHTTRVPFHDENTAHSIHCIPSLQMALDHGLDPSLVLAVTLLDFEPDLPLAPVFKQALENGADPNATLGSNGTFFEQSRMQYEDVVDEGWGLKSDWTLSFFSMLQLAVLSGCHGDPSAKMEMLLQNGADINQATKEEVPQTALHLAVKVGCLACIRFLLNHGARIDAQAYTMIDDSLKKGPNNRLRIKMLLDAYDHQVPTGDGNLMRDAAHAELSLIACEPVYHNHRSDFRDQPTYGGHKDSWGFYHQGERIYNPDKGAWVSDESDGGRWVSDKSEVETLNSFVWDGGMDHSGELEGESDDSNGSDGESVDSHGSGFMLDFVRMTNL